MPGPVRLGVVVVVVVPLPLPVPLLLPLVVMVVVGDVVGVDDVVLVLVLELDEELEELDELDVVAGGHDSEVLLTGPGRFSDERGAPGASWKYSV